MKTCKKCGQTKEFKDFPKRESSQDGLRGDCKDCYRKYILDYRKRLADNKAIK